ncbi:hypothetical protein CPB86DRAFT_784446 [Serendipita vermifera]|nr:hypothetical protein CPB86DRAFT_784446 [Serendipita vermifera]
MAELVNEATGPQTLGQTSITNGTSGVPAAQGQGLTMPPTAPPEQGGRSLRKRAPTMDTLSSPTHEGDRTTRSGASFANRPKWMPKLKLKVNESSDGRRQSFLGPYDRDLDSEDEDLVFEEQFLLRMPPGKELERLREIVAKRGAASDIWFKFKDPRRAVFHIGDSLHPAKLVDLPCIIESQKTLDNKHMFKVSDICQMLVVEDTNLPSEEALLAHKKAFNANEFIWPHGMTPPLRHVRKRRFRKRLNRQAIETVEQEVERLLSEEKNGVHVEETLFEDADPDASDSEFLRKVMPPESPDEGSEMGDVKEENEDDAFAAIIEQALQEASDDDDEDDDDDDSEDEDDDDDGDRDDDGGSASGSGSGSGSGSDADEDDEEYSGAMKLVADEIRHLEAAIAKKNEDIAKVTNVALKNRFMTAVAKMTADLEGKLAHRERLLAEHRAQKEKEEVEDGDESEDDGEAGGEELFGDPMDIA